MSRFVVLEIELNAAHRPSAANVIREEICEQRTAVDPSNIATGRTATLRLHLARPRDRTNPPTHTSARPP
jgi:hypothetical protein